MIVDLRIFIACLGQTWFIDVSFGLESLSMRCLIIGLWYIAYLRGYSDGDTTEKGHAYLTTMCTQCQGDSVVSTGVRHTISTIMNKNGNVTYKTY